MEAESVSLINYVPSFARGNDLLLVHHDRLSLVYLSSLLEQYSFKVTATYDTFAAASMIYAHEGRFKLVVAKAYLPSMDALSFLNILFEKDIPVIFICSKGFVNLTQKVLATKLCYHNTIPNVYFLEEPFCPEDFKCVCQHMSYSMAYSAKETRMANFQDKVQAVTCKRYKDEDGSKLKEKTAELCSAMMKRQVHTASGRRNLDDNGLKLEDKRAKLSLAHAKCKFRAANGRRNDNDNGGKLKEKRVEFSSAQMKFYNKDRYSGSARCIWTPVLHLRFTEAIRVLGGVDNARPKAILFWMNEPHLTVCQVTSHLQKFRLKLKQNACNSDLPSVSGSSHLRSNTMFPSAFESSSSGTEGLPASTASLNESQNLIMNNAKTQEQDILKQLESARNPTLTYDFPTEVTKCGSQSLNSTVGHPVPAASMEQNQPATEFDDLTKMLLEDCDSFDGFGNEPNPGDVDQYSETLSTVLQGYRQPQQIIRIG